MKQETDNKSDIQQGMKAAFDYFDKVSSFAKSQPVNEVKQTAVEWLVDKLETEAITDYSFAQAHKVITLDVYSFNALIEQAKQMEKEQIMNARLDGFMASAQGWNGEYPGWDVKETSIKINNEQYYNETYSK